MTGKMGGLPLPSLNIKNRLHGSLQEELLAHTTH